MTRFSVGIHIICLVDTPLSCVVIKSGYLIKEHPHDTEELMLMLKTYEPDVILVTYSYGKDSLAAITALLSDINDLQSSVELVLNPVHAIHAGDNANINARLIQLIRNSSYFEEDFTVASVLNNATQVLSHDVLANLVTIAEHANVMIANSSAETEQCEMFVARLQLVQSKIHDIVSELEALNLNKEFAR